MWPDCHHAVKTYVDYCRALLRKPNAVGYVEQRWYWDLRLWGTADFVCVSQGPRNSLQTIDVVDLKGGRGVKVEASSPQMGLYGLMVQKTLELYDHSIITHVVQPRYRKGHIDTYEYDEGELDELKDWALAAMKSKVISPSATACLWCPVKYSCAERLNADMASELVDLDA